MTSLKQHGGGIDVQMERRRFTEFKIVLSRTSRIARRTGLTVELLLGLSEIPRLHLDAVDMEVRHVDVPRLRPLQRQAARMPGLP
jgi:hypothetical protein